MLSRALSACLQLIRTLSPPCTQEDAGEITQRAVKRTVLALLVATLCHAPTAIADNTTSAGKAELDKAVQSLRPAPSIDVTPIEFSIGPAHYRMPRNYLLSMENWNGGPQTIVTIAVTLPGLLPLSPQTLQCFKPPPPGQPAECRPFTVTIQDGSDGTSRPARRRL